MIPGLIVLEVCDANRACSPTLCDIESEYPIITVLENSCMNQCDLCARQCYVFLDGDVLSSADPDELFRQIRQQIQKLSDHYESEI